MSLPDKVAAKTQCSMTRTEYHTTKVEAGMRLDSFLLIRLPDASKGGIRGLLAAGECLVDGVPQTAGYRLGEGQCIHLLRDTIASIPPEDRPLRILYEDEILLAIDKDAGMLTHPTSHERTGTVANALRHLFLKRGWEQMRPHFLHRLDRQTSGVLLIAKQLERHAPAGRLFESRLVRKSYYAIAGGVPQWEEIQVQIPIGRVAGRKPQWQSLADGLPSETRLILERNRGSCSLLRAEPVTGRTNQIRIHCAAIGFPILGDAAYGGQEADRLYLHAWRLVVPEAGRGKPITITSELPLCFGGIAYKANDVTR
jgi:23S rRNA pseudouridine1911/1915/1917 synthase